MPLHKLEGLQAVATMYSPKPFETFGFLARFVPSLATSIKTLLAMLNHGRVQLATDMDT